MGDLLSERLDSCLLTDRQGNVLLRPGLLANELLQKTCEQRASRLHAWSSPRGARGDTAPSSTDTAHHVASIDAATLSRPIAEEFRKASAYRRSKLEYAHAAPPKNFEARLPNKCKPVSSSRRCSDKAVSLLVLPELPDRERRKREDIQAEVVARHERLLSGSSRASSHPSTTRRERWPRACSISAADCSRPRCARRSLSRTPWRMTGPSRATARKGWWPCRGGTCRSSRRAG